MAFQDTWELSDDDEDDFSMELVVNDEDLIDENEDDAF